jgi:hypothetical protein
MSIEERFEPLESYLKLCSKDTSKAEELRKKFEANGLLKVLENPINVPEDKVAMGRLLI